MTIYFAYKQALYVQKLKKQKKEYYYDYHAGKRGRKHRTRPEEVQT